MKKTAVEWLEKQLDSTQLYWLKDWIEQAKAMEKEQIVDAYDNGAEEWTTIEYSDGQHYYNHNFES
jgi:hypothetical protein